MITVKKLTQKGNEKFKSFCEKKEISFNIDDFDTEEIEQSIEIDENKIFQNKYELGEYLYNSLKDFKADIDNGIWHFLVIIYHEQLLKNNKIGEIYRFFIDENKYFSSQRHLLKSVFDLYALYHNKPTLVKFLLLNAINETGDLFRIILENQDMVKNENFIKVAKTVFYDKKNQKLKKRNKEGGLRLINLYKQYERTYDLYSMPSEKILKNLISKHKEFKMFKKGFINKDF